jgi:hypothetical protein
MTENLKGDNTSMQNNYSTYMHSKGSSGLLCKLMRLSWFLTLVYSCTISLAASSPGQRPTMRVGKGNRLEFCQYAAANGSTYGPNCKLKIDDIHKAWTDVSDVVIDGTFEIKRTDPQQRAAAVFVANKLTINDGGQIVTNGNVLFIFVNEFVAFNNASIISFETANRKAADGSPQTGVGGVQGITGLPGPPGNAGVSGEGGGTVTIFANNFSGPLEINISGQDGGNGNKGGRGGNGLMGFKGEDASWGIDGCHHGGGGGGPGGNGGSGGIGGAAGRGGDGGVVGFFYVTSTSVDPPKNPRISIQAGSSGSPGSGGDGGSAGEGGLGGNGGGPCGGGPRGAWGAAGGSQGNGTPAAPAVNGSVQLIRLSSMSKIEEGFKNAAAQ